MTIYSQKSEPMLHTPTPRVMLPITELPKIASLTKILKEKFLFVN